MVTFSVLPAEISRGAATPTDCAPTVIGTRTAADSGRFREESPTETRYCPAAVDHCARMVNDLRQLLDDLTGG